jgi:hypothetical protein
VIRQQVIPSFAATHLVLRKVSFVHDQPNDQVTTGPIWRSTSVRHTPARLGGTKQCEWPWLGFVRFAYCLRSALSLLLALVVLTRVGRIKKWKFVRTAGCTARRVRAFLHGSRAFSYDQGCRLRQDVELPKPLRLCPSIARADAGTTRQTGFPIAF